VSAGPIVIGYDGSAASERAVREAGGLLSDRSALVVVVWEAGLAFEMAELPTAGVGIPPVPLDIRTAAEVDRAMYEGVQHQAEQGAALAREAGFDAEPLVAADEGTVAETLVRVAQERDARAIVVGARGHGGLGRLLLGSTSTAVVQHASRPVLVVHEPAS
jgi:nucleotide-binding universal stress UspA family protein